MTSTGHRMTPQATGYTAGGASSHSPVNEPNDLEDIIERLHIGTLQREKLKARRSILTDENGTLLTQHEAEILSQSETYSVTSEESYGDNRPKRKISGTSSKDSGIGKDSSPKADVRPKGNREIRSKDQEVQTTFGKNFKYAKVHDMSAVEEGKIAHHKEDKPKVSKVFKVFRQKKHSQTDDNHGDSQSDLGASLPQTFIVKYMGKRPTKGYGGAKYTQGPVEEIVEHVDKLPKGSDLPLVKLEVNLDGLNMTPHKRNKVKSFESVFVPIQYISYGSQDQNYPRVFCFIMVREMSARSKKLDCHVYACDSSKNARKLAGLLALAFQLYQETMEGKSANYSTPVGPDPFMDDDTKSSYEA